MQTMTLIHAAHLEDIDAVCLKSDQRLQALESSFCSVTVGMMFEIQVIKFFETEFNEDVFSFDLVSTAKPLDMEEDSIGQKGYLMVATDNELYTHSSSVQLSAVGASLYAAISVAGDLSAQLEDRGATESQWGYMMDNWTWLKSLAFCLEEKEKAILVDLLN